MVITEHDREPNSGFKLILCRIQGDLSFKLTSWRILANLMKFLSYLETFWCGKSPHSI